MVEAGITITVFVLLTMGIIEFGRAWMVANMITQAARDGGRTAAVVPPVNRDGDGKIKAGPKADIVLQVKTQIGNVLDPTTLDALNVDIQQPTVSGVNEVVVTVSGPVPYIFNLPFVGTSFNVNRVVTFRDEGR